MGRADRVLEVGLEAVGGIGVGQGVAVGIPAGDGPGRQVDADPFPRLAVRELVRSRTAAQAVAPGPPFEGVAPRAPGERVRVGASEHPFDVRLEPAHHRVRVGQGVALRDPAGDGPGREVHVDPGIRRAVAHRVRAAAARQPIPARGPEQRVLSRVPDERVRVRRAPHPLDAGQGVALRLAPGARPGREVDRHAGPGELVARGVRSCPAGEGVRARTAHQHIRFAVARQGVGVRGPADVLEGVVEVDAQNVPLGVPAACGAGPQVHRDACGRPGIGQPVRPPRAGQRVRARAALDHVVPIAARDGVVVRRPQHPFEPGDRVAGGVPARGSAACEVHRHLGVRACVGEPVLAAPPGQPVAAGPAFEGVGPVASEEGVGPARSAQAVRTARPAQPVARAGSGEGVGVRGPQHRLDVGLEPAQRARVGQRVALGVSPGDRSGREAHRDARIRVGIGDPVGARAARERVRARPAGQRVVVRPAGQHVAAFPAEEQVVPGPAVQRVVVPGHRRVAQPVRVRPVRRERVGRVGPAVEGVVPRGARERVRAVPALELVRLRVARQRVVRGRAEDVLEPGDAVSLRVAARRRPGGEVHRDPRGAAFGTEPGCIAVGHPVGAAAAGERVRACASVEHVVARPAVQGVGPARADQAVARARALDAVVPGAALEHVRAIVSGQGVVAGAALRAVEVLQRVVPGPGGPPRGEVDGDRRGQAGVVGEVQMGGVVRRVAGDRVVPRRVGGDPVEHAGLRRPGHLRASPQALRRGDVVGQQRVASGLVRVGRRGEPGEHHSGHVAVRDPQHVAELVQRRVVDPGGRGRVRAVEYDHLLMDDGPGVPRPGGPQRPAPAVALAGAGPGDAYVRVRRVRDFDEPRPAHRLPRVHRLADERPGRFGHRIAQIRLAVRVRGDVGGRERVGDRGLGAGPGPAREHVALSVPQHGSGLPGRRHRRRGAHPRTRRIARELNSASPAGTAPSRPDGGRHT